MSGKYIEWKHLSNLYDKVSSAAVCSKGVTLLPKLKLEHVRMTPFSRMRVDLAAQVSDVPYSGYISRV